ncbi:unnamed protein product [Caenorhabditis nigoni]
MKLPSSNQRRRSHNGPSRKIAIVGLSSFSTRTGSGEAVQFLGVLGGASACARTNPTPRNHNTPESETEQGQVAHFAAAERPASAVRPRKQKGRRFWL